MRTWLQASLPRGASPVHRYLKAEEKVWVGDFETSEGIVNNPMTMMSYRENKWKSWWTPSPQRLACLNAGLSELQSQAMVALEDIDPLG
eukprot:3658633-Pyramimonas_sp.AAC.1